MRKEEGMRMMRGRCRRKGGGGRDGEGGREKGTGVNVIFYWVNQ